MTDCAFSAPSCFDEACERQAAVQARVAAGERLPAWRWASLREGYRGPVPVLSHGTGVYAVREADGRVCEFAGRWSDDGTVLLCVDCWEDGT